MEISHLNGAQLEVLTRIIVDDRNKIIAQVPFLVTAVLVPILGGHQGGNVENSLHDVIMPAVGELSILATHI